MTEIEDAQAAAPEQREDAVAGEDALCPRPASESMATSASQRTRLVPPDGKPFHWTSRYRRQIHAAEWVAIAVCLSITCYFLSLLVFPAGNGGPVSGPPPSRETFRAQLRSLPPAGAVPEWGVSARIGRWRSIVIHHSATVSGNPEAFDRYHRDVRKWENGLGYHFVIGNGQGMQDGEVAIGNRWREQLDGAHVKNNEGNANSYSIGICLVGSFNDSLPTARQFAALKGLLTFLRREYGIGLASIVGHNAAAAGATDCPGRYFFVDEVALALANP